MEEMIGKVIHSDCLDVMKKIPSESIDLVFADYPFSYFLKDDKKVTKEQEVDSFVKKTADEFHRILKKDGNLAIFWQSIMAYKYTKHFSDIFKVRNIVCVKDIIKWSWWFLPYQYNMLYLLSKGKRSSNWEPIEKLTDWWDEYETGQKFYNEQTPMPVVEKTLKMMSKEGQLVFDCFAGRGNIEVACINLNRKFIGCEIQKENCEKAIFRIKTTRPLDKWI